MAVAISDLRFRIADYARNIGVQPESPRPAGTADGTTTLFYLPLGKAQYVAGSAQLYYTPTTGSITPLPNSGSTAYSISQQGQIMFPTAPGAGGSAIPNASVIAATYQQTVFADADLTNVLNRALAGGYSTDSQILAACQIELIDAIMSDVERMSMLREAEYQLNPQAVVQSYVKLLAELREQIMGTGRPGQAVPFMMRGGVPVRSYQPRQ